ncbi:MAG: glycosyltransferase family 4 protein [Clostridia bacterium]|nr:glycosyltransferase family 4 protein [Clostridia bacterium]
MKVLLTATVQSHICQFHRPLVELLHAHGYEVHVAAKDNLAEKNGLKLDFVEKVWDVPFSRSPKSMDHVKAYRCLKKLIDEGGYDIIHCNTPMGGIVTRLAARKARKKGTKVYYTAHGFHFYEGAPFKNWLFYYPVEKFFANHFTDKLIVISDADLKTAKAHGFRLPMYRIHSVGINSKKYYPRGEEEKTLLRQTLGIGTERFVALCTGELNRNKNQIKLLSAVSQIVKEVPQFELLLAGNGPEQEHLEAYIAGHHLENHVRLIGYRTDLETYLTLSDIAISVSIREGLGINLIEAMACGKPVIASDNRGHREFVRNGQNGYLLGDDSFSANIAAVIKEMYNDAEQIKKMSEQAENDAKQYLDVQVMKELADIYSI